MDELISAQILKLKQAGLYRERLLSPANYLNFCSNDYLSLMSEPVLQQAYQEGFSRYPCGSGGSAMISGYHEVHHQLESSIATALGVDDAILFSSGYAANLAMMTLLASCHVSLLIDKSLHASMYDGLKLAQVNYRRYRHHDLENLKTQLNRSSDHSMVITEGLFSMSGQIAALDDIIKLCQPHQALCIVVWFIWPRGLRFS
jgi:8-amino-7-oxononanoate synthase